VSQSEGGRVRAWVSARLGQKSGWRRPYAVARLGRVMLNPSSGARLHLGCGGVYLAGYLNVDLPSEEGAAFGASRPDLESDILLLDCPQNVLSEVRLHHVFEHFERAQALGLLVRWFGWLEPAGELVIETPDFERTVEEFSERNFAEQTLILRHLFGSQEATWARHLDGWSAPRFREVLGRLGFIDVRTSQTTSDSDGLLRNVVVRARKPSSSSDAEMQLAAVDEILVASMNGLNPTEERLAACWRATLYRTLEP
jgi:hypothetical protein